MIVDAHLAREEEVRRAAGLVRWLDHAITIPGTNIGVGLDAAIGFLLPAAGDAVTGVASIGLLVVAIRRGVPSVVIARMLMNIAVDTFIGMLPVVGDLFDVVWRSNTRNLALIERHEGELRPRARAADYAIVAAGVALVGISIAAPFILIAWLIGLLA